MKNNRGWMRIIEAFIAVMLVAGLLIFIVESTQNKNQDLSSQIYDSEYSILRGIQLDNSLRSEILAQTIPKSWDLTNDKFSGWSGQDDVSAKIASANIPNLKCQAKLCNVGDLCTDSTIPASNNVYVQSIFISASDDRYNPIKLNLFCYGKTL